MIEELRLKEKILNDLTSRVLILKEAARLGLTTNDEELRDAIESVPSFQVNGRFDSRVYERFLRLNRMSTEDFERMQRESLMLSKLVNLIKLNGAKVSEEEVQETYLFENERINLNFLKISPESFKTQVNVNEVEIKDYFQKHQEEFRVPNFVRVQYLIFRPSDFEGKAQVSPDEIKRYYDLQKDRFKTPKKARVREILIKVSAQDAVDKIDEKRKKAEEILEKAKKTKDFGSIAKQYSEANSASKGGDLGWIQGGTIDESLERLLFSMKAGELTGVIKGAEGFYIFKVEDAAEEKLKSFEEVKDQILQTLKKGKATTEASRKADDAFYSLFRSRDLEGFAREKDVPIKSTGFFKEGDEIPEIGKSPVFQSGAFSLKVRRDLSCREHPPQFLYLEVIG